MTIEAYLFNCTYSMAPSAATQFCKLYNPTSRKYTQFCLRIFDSRRLSLKAVELNTNFYTTTTFNKLYERQIDARLSVNIKVHQCESSGAS